MNKILFQIIIFLLSLNSILFSQTVVKEYNTNSKSIECDQFNDIYLSDGKSIKKYNFNFELLSEYTNTSLGNIDSYDVFNPFKILVYHKNYNKIVLLDKTLSYDNSQMSLDDYYNANLVCLSGDNNLWVFDNVTKEIIKLDKNKKVISNSGNINQLLNIEVSPILMKEYNQNLYLYDSINGFIVFDIYGTFNKIIPLKKMSNIKFLDEYLFGLENKKIIFYNTKNIETKEIEIRDSLVDFAINRDYLFLLLKDKLLIEKNILK